MRLFEEYKRTLKMLEVEELLDLIFYRPMAFLFVKGIFNTDITPNQLTLLSILFGVLCGIALAFGTPEAYLFSGIFLIIYDVLDCSDGQLARLKKNGTNLGRILDGFGDYIVSIAAYLGLGFGFASNSQDPFFWWVLTVAAGASNAVHSSLLDYYRNRFLDYVLERKRLLGDDLKYFRDEYNRLSGQKGKIFEKILLWFYLGYSSIQLKFSKSSIETEEKKYDPGNFYNRNKLIMHFWTYIGPTTEFTFLIVTAFVNRLDIFIIGMVTIGNVIAILLYIFQRNIDSSTDLAVQV